MRLEDIIGVAPYARRPMYVAPDNQGRPRVQYWITCDTSAYRYGQQEAAFMICYPDMIPKSQLTPGDIAQYTWGRDDWEPYPGRYVIDFRKRYMRIDPRSMIDPRWQF